MSFMFNKIATLIFWLLCFLAWVFDWPDVLSWLPACAVVVLGIHLLEVVYFWIAFRRKSTAPGKDSLLIMVFGIFHLRQFIDEEEASAE
ncbi:MAG: hypothetical protein CMI08_05320 [Oceanospirillaceae bacterium]|uniref:DUF1145 domain-containing protein n=1 Tax=unclassified Thalassolituus TaxID=2624967 RepID=UPI000C0BA927|nr:MULTISPECIES: DUF1145 domain-containing protein [unclassified Thalassolituus]MAK92340.1 hypothetical protein [Thalassolituus sp.]MAS24052.1 hypothetical protein [Oceanospirillaceae bacterium]MAX98620.1 hypothetical protein [Oceanospirillaceae bacterium]MBS53633.1 hypothetical protein [Oceanospirillaceae bacterium]|tara:strand:- start:330 stop:596 length:267 start_codon:yes stop_codon:yes gene_type:complete